MLKPAWWPQLASEKTCIFGYATGRIGDRQAASSNRFDRYAPMDIDAQKRKAAACAVEWVRPGMRLGLGTGSTAKHFVELLAERVAGGLQVIGVPTSETTRADAQRLGVPLTTLDETPELDMTVDGADEIGPDLTLIKGGGGAL